MRLGTNVTGAVSFGTYADEGRQIYGDLDNVARDASKVRDVIQNQGTDLVLEVLAEHVAKVYLQFALGMPELERLKKSMTDSLTELINERT